MIKASNNPFSCEPNDQYPDKLDKGGYTGTAKDLDDKINLVAFPDDFLVIGEITKTGNTVSIQPLTFQWRIDQILFENQNLFSTIITPATEGYNRIDIIVATNFGAFIKIQGIEGIDSAQEPPIPENTLRATFISVFGSEITEPTPPIAGDAYIAKSEATFKKLSGSGYKAAFSITDEVTNFLVVAATSLGSISVSTANKKFIYDGKDHYLKNANNGVLQVLHLSGTGNFKYSFPNGETLSIKNNEIVHFKWRFDAINSGFLDYVGLTASLRPYNIFKFIQKGFGNANLTINEVGDIFSGWKNDGTVRYSEAKWLGGALNNSDNFIPLVQTEI